MLWPPPVTFTVPPLTATGPGACRTPPITSRFTESPFAAALTTISLADDATMLSNVADGIVWKLRLTPYTPPVTVKSVGPFTTELNTTVPRLTTTGPVNMAAPANVSVPAPFLTRPPAPRTALLNVELKPAASNVVAPFLPVSSVASALVHAPVEWIVAPPIETAQSFVDSCPAANVSLKPLLRNTSPPLMRM